MLHNYSRRRGYHSQRRFDHWRFWVLVIIGVAITAGAVVMAFIK